MKNNLLKIVSIMGIMSFSTIGLSGCGAKSNVPKPTPLIQTIPHKIQVIPNWSFSVGDTPPSQVVNLAPAYKDNMVVAASYNGKVAAVDANSGKVLWQVKTNQQLTSGVTIGESAIYIGTLGGKLLALSKTSGKVLWQKQLGSSLYAPVAVDAQTVVAHVHNGDIVALEAKTGKQLWSYTADQPSLLLAGDSAPVISSGVVLVGLHSGLLISLNLKDGSVKWSTPIALPSGSTDVARMVDIVAKPLIENGMVYIASYNGEIAAVSLDSGKVIWSHPVSTYRNIALANGKVVVSTTNSEVVAFDQMTGRTAWTQKDFQYRMLSAPSILNNIVVVTDWKGYAYWLNLQNGALLTVSQPTDAAITAAGAVYKNTIFFYGANGQLIASQVSSSSL